MEDKDQRAKCAISSIDSIGCPKNGLGATLGSVVELTDMSCATIARDLRALTNDGIIKRVGSRKTGHWILGDTL